MTVLTVADSELDPALVTSREIVSDLVEEVTFRHEPNDLNVRNNRGFALYNGRLVEIVRRGLKNTRVRYSLDDNGQTLLVPTAELEGYTHPTQAL
jgi:hypothetical protein